MYLRWWKGWPSNRPRVFPNLSEDKHTTLTLITANVLRSDTSSQYWMGAVRDPQDRNNWKWLGGEDVTVSFWNLPGGDEDCARYDGAKGWLWSDTNCNVKINYICQHR